MLVDGLRGLRVLVWVRGLEVASRPAGPTMTAVYTIVLCVLLSSAFAFIFAKAGLYAALRCAIKKHTPEELVCLRCIDEKRK
jgi:hypothetical protein